jgi:hypothetical protein
MVMDIGLKPLMNNGLKDARFKWRRGATMILLIIILILVFGGGGGYYGHTRWGPGGGAGVGLGTILVILLIAYLLGLFR